MKALFQGSVFLVSIILPVSVYPNAKESGKEIATKLLDYLESKDSFRDACLLGKNPWKDMGIIENDCLIKTLFPCRSVDSLGVQLPYASNFISSPTASAESEVNLSSKEYPEHQLKDDEALELIESILPSTKPAACLPNDRSGA